MKIQLTIDISGSRNGQPWPARGEVVDLPDAEATHMVAAGQGIPVEDEPAPEPTPTPPPAPKAAGKPKPPAKKPPAKPAASGLTKAKAAGKS